MTRRYPVKAQSTNLRCGTPSTTPARSRSRSTSFGSKWASTWGTSIARILADELEVSWENVEIVHVDSARKWGLMVTGGSWSVSQSWPVYCQAGAAGRVALIEAAAKKWGVSPDSCVARGGRVVCGKQEISYAELVTLGVTREFSEAELKALPLKADADLRLVGKPVTSLDIANKTTGDAVFGIDARVEGMVYASPLLPPTRYGVGADAELTQLPRCH
ncbi:MULTISPECIES: molybdopterin cofactor-binding domain-containing protein [Pseudomonas]|uniref:molybdopterin cofactor-binding domain-containing protein n=1 Tax=Pseudomonas faucium TaxID=2740518 RepID=UPI001E40E448|nr:MULTISPECIES: molybdopterin cofactor-binding domain-containing protein [Pseudomonas]